MERALSLVAMGTLTIKIIWEAVKGKISLPRTLNSRESMWRMEFSDTAWGKVTCGYAKSAHGLSKAKYDLIIGEAMESAHACIKGDATSGASASGAMESAVQVQAGASDECANLISYSDLDLDEECMFSLPFSPLD